MQPRFTEEEALRRMSKLPGFLPDEDGLGHKVLSPHGLVWTRGARLTDEVFESASFGTINISAINHHTNDAKGPFQPIRIADAVKNVAKIDINTSYAKRIPKDRLREPILVIFGPDGWHIIDGAHRIYRLNALRKKVVHAKMLRPEVFGYARVKRWIQSDTGEWLPFDTVSDEAVEAAIAGGQAFLHRMESMFVTQERA